MKSLLKHTREIFTTILSLEIFEIVPFFHIYSPLWKKLMPESVPAGFSFSEVPLVKVFLQQGTVVQCVIIGINYMRLL